MPDQSRTEDIERRFEQCYEESWLPTFRFALAWTNDWGSAEDLAQEAFARLWAGRAKVDWTQPLLPWLLVVTRRLAMDRFRRLRSAARAFDGGGETRLDSDARLRWIDVRASMAGLTAHQRSALVLVHVLGLPVSDAATTLGISGNAVRAAISRARERLDDR
jgi:RNA polymerase sigma factor (sigma-70 family)